MPTGNLAAGFRPVWLPDTRPATVPADQFLVWTPASGWPADGHGGTRRPSGRPDVQSNVTAWLMGMDAPGLRGSRGGHFSTGRPAMRLAS